MNATQEHLRKLIAESRERQRLAVEAAAKIEADKKLVAQSVESALKAHTQFDTTTEGFSWNAEQQKGIDLAVTHKSFNLIGAAGTGKTTTTKEIVRLLVSKGIVKPLTMSTKYLVKDAPGLVLTSFTRRAVRNLRRAVSADLTAHCITLHKLLEYEPVFYEVVDPATGDRKNTMRFEPARNAKNPLPSSLTTIVIDESSMVSVELFKKLLEALPHAAKVQFIFIGDLHQLPPVYGQAILGFKLLELPTVELTQIYRQAQNSPIISLAHKIKDGKDIPVTEKKTEESPQGRVTLHPWKKPLSDFDAAHAAGLFLRALVTDGDYDEEEDIILCPQGQVKNTAFGTDEFNRIIAQSLGEKRKAVVFEIVAGFNKHYLAVGDRLLVGREDAKITKISRNARYWGARPRPPSDQLDRWGNYKTKIVEASDAGEDFDADKYLDSLTLTPTDTPEDRKQEASHMIDVELLDSGLTETISTAGEINSSMFAYCLTVHKSQGSEWKRVFFLTHQSHVAQWSRELLYTAVTRARESLYMIIEPDRRGKAGTLTKAAHRPRIKGNTLAEKAEHFKGKEKEYLKGMESLKDLEFGTSREGKAIAEPTERIKVSIPAGPSIPLVKMEHFVSAHFKAICEGNLKKYWEQATKIWGARIGNLPTIAYDLQTSKTIGLAALQRQHIRLNSVWCVLADDLPEIMAEMTEETLIHEVCHLVAWNFSKDRGHDSGWRMAMKLMGKAPAVYADFAGMPEWSKKYNELMIQKQNELKATKNADIADDFTATDTDEV